MNLEEWSYAATVLTALVAVLAAVYAGRQVKLARLDRQDRNRPFVTVSLERSHTIAASIVLRNQGSTVARNVKFRFSPEWESSDSKRTAIRESAIWTRGIATMAPGQQIAMFADIFPDRFKTDLPRAYEVSVECEGPSRRFRAAVRYVDTYTLDFDAFYGYATAGSYGLHEVADALRTITRHLGAWSESANGPLRVIVRDGDQRDAEEAREYERDMAQRAAEKRRRDRAAEPTTS